MFRTKPHCDRNSGLIFCFCTHLFRTYHKSNAFCSFEHPFLHNIVIAIMPLYLWYGRTANVMSTLSGAAHKGRGEPRDPESRVHQTGKTNIYILLLNVFDSRSRGEKWSTTASVDTFGHLCYYFLASKYDGTAEREEQHRRNIVMDMLDCCGRNMAKTPHRPASPPCPLRAPCSRRWEQWQPRKG